MFPDMLGHRTSEIGAPYWALRRHTKSRAVVFLRANLYRPDQGKLPRGAETLRKNPDKGYYPHIQNVL